MSVLSSVGSPLLVLRWFGFVCPCLEKDDDKNARQALQYVNAAGRRSIHWILHSDHDEDSKNSVVLAFIGNLFGNTSNGSITSTSNGSAGAGNGRLSPKITSVSATKTKTTTTTTTTAPGVVRAQLFLCDGVEGDPEIWIQGETDDDINADLDAPQPVLTLAPQPPSKDEKAPCVGSSSKTGKGEARQKNAVRIPLRRVDRVTLDGNHVCLLARQSNDDKYQKQQQQSSTLTTSPSSTMPPSKSSLMSLSPLSKSPTKVTATKQSRSRPKILARFEILQPSSSSSSSSVVGASNQDRNFFVHYMSVLIEWERQRRQAAGYYDDDDEDDDDHDGVLVGANNFLTSRAKKAAHFARRELELQQTRRDRDRRKAKLVQESGGLKFTALAMANRGAENSRK